MPIPSETYYRDAADSRITWKEALRSTRVLDNKGRINFPQSEKEKQCFEEKVESLRFYSTITKDKFLNKILQRF